MAQRSMLPRRSSEPLAALDLGGAGSASSSVCKRNSWPIDAKAAAGPLAREPVELLFERPAPVARPRPGQPAPEASPLSSHLLKRRHSGTTTLTINVDQCKPGMDSVYFDARLAEEYTVVATIGEGSTSFVQHGIRKSDGLPVAMKNLLTGVDSELVQVAKMEFDMLMQLRHPSIVHALDFKMSESRAVLVMERFEGSTLQDAVRKSPQGCLEEECVRQLALKLLEGVDYLHRRRIVHRDLKPQNILVSCDLEDLRIIDFNTAHDLRNDGRALTPTGTPLYVAPEVLLGESPSEPSDVWSIGLCVYFSISGILPQMRDSWSTQRMAEVACREIDFSGPRWQGVSKSCVAFLRHCLAGDKRDRPAPMTLLQDPWLTGSSPSTASVPDEEKIHRHRSWQELPSRVVPQDTRRTSRGLSWLLNDDVISQPSTRVPNSASSCGTPHKDLWPVDPL